MAISYQRKLGDGTIVIDSGTSNVGIGTNDPANKLTVYRGGGVRVTGITSGDYIEMSGDLPGYSANQYPVIKSGGTIHFANNNKYSAYIEGNNTYFGILDNTPTTKVLLHTSGNSYLNGGNVGIGTTNPPRKLSVETNDTATYSASVNASEISIARKNSSNTAGQVAAISLNATGWSGQTTGVVVLNAIARQGNFSNADFAIQNRVGGNFVETFRITTYGNVGIGTDTPDDNVNTGSYFKPDGGGRFLTVKDSSGSFIMLESSTTTDDDQIGGIYFNNTGGQADAHVHVAGIDAILHKHGTNDALSGGDLRFFTKPSGSGVNGPRMVILQNGNVGIGTTSPEHKLHIAGRTQMDYLKVGGDTSSSSTYIYDGYLDAGSAYFHQPTALIRTDSSATGGLDEAPVALAMFNRNGTNNTWVKMSFASREVNSAGNTVSIAGIAAQKTAGTQNNWASGKLYLWTKNGAAFVQNMTLIPNGNVGIGTTSPTLALDVRGTQGSPSSSGTSQTGSLSIRGGGSHFMSSGMLNVSPWTGWFQAQDANNLATTYPLALNPNGGNVGIGTTSPGAKLNIATSSVWGTAVTEALTIDNTGSAGNINTEHSLGRIRWRTNGVIGASIDAIRDTPGAGHNVDIAFSTNTGGSGTSAAERMRINYNGNVGIGTTSPSAKLDVDGVIRSRGGTYAADTDTKTDVGLVIPENNFIYTADGSDYLRKLIGKTSDIITIGEAGTSLIDGINLVPGTAGGYVQIFNNSSIAAKFVDGKLGIGTTSPDEKLSVIGNTGLYGTVSGGIVSPASLRFFTSEDGAGLGDSTDSNKQKIGQITWAGKDTSLNATGEYAAIRTYVIDSNNLIQGSAGEGGQIEFSILRHDVGANPRVEYTAMTINNSANVGIGTTSPSTKLYVDGGESTFNRGNSDGAIARFRGNNAEQAVIGTVTSWFDSNVGIGTTSVPSEANLSLAAKTTTEGGHLVINKATSSTHATHIDNNTDTFRIMKGTDSASGSVQFILNHTNGNVGIGTTSPNYKLSVDDNTITTAPKTVLQFDAASITDNGGYNIDFRTSSNDAADRYVARIRGIRESTGALSQLSFWTESGSALLQRMTIRASGNVGIGTTSPTLGLHVANGLGALFGPSGSGASTYISADDENTINGGYGLDTDTADLWVNYRGYQNGTSRFRDFRVGNGKNGVIAFFDGSTGNVGIGTTGPGFKLQVGTPAVVSGSDYSWSFDLTRANSTSRGFSIGQADGGGVVVMGGHNTDMAFGHTFGTDTNGNPLFYETMRIQHVDQAVGNVGIGTTSPTRRLHVRSTDEATGIFLERTSNYGFVQYNEQVGSVETYHLGFVNNNTLSSDILVANELGNVGIGRTSPSYRLTVDNDAANTNNPALYVKNPNSSTAAVIAEFVGDSDSIQIKNIGTGDYAIYNSQQSNGIALFDGVGGVEIKYAGTTTLESDSTGGIKVTGQLSATGDVVAYSSDKRLKENIKPIENAVDKIKQLKGVTFDWNEKSEELGFEPSTKTNDVGVIAQDVEAVFPQLVHLAPFDIGSDEEGKATSKTGEDYKTVNYARLTAVLIEAVKEQQQQIDELKAKLDGITK